VVEEKEDSVNRRGFLKMLGMAAAVPLSKLAPSEPRHVGALKRNIELVKSGEVSLYPGRTWYIHDGLDEALELIPPIHPNCRCSIEPQWFYPYIDASTGEIRGVPEKYMTFFDGRIPVEVEDAQA
jgi:hypothetical protein